MLNITEKAFESINNESKIVKVEKPDNLTKIAKFSSIQSHVANDVNKLNYRL